MTFKTKYIGTGKATGFALLAAMLWFSGSSLRANEPAISWDAPVRVASGDARVGPWRMNESEFHYVDDPTVAINVRGTIAVAWADQKKQDIYFQRFDSGEQSGAPVNVSRSPDIFSWLPRMIVTNDEPEHIYILWQEIVFSGGSHGGEAFFTRSTDGGKTFDKPMNLSYSQAGDGKGRLTKILWHNGSLDLARGPTGELYAAWTEYEGRLWLSRSQNEGESFTTPVPIAGDQEKPARGPSLAVDSSGMLCIAFSAGEDKSADIHLAVSDDGGRSFSEPRTIHPNNGHADAPKLAIDGEDRIHLVYGESPAGAGLLERYHVRYTRSEDQGQSFVPAKTISGTPGGDYRSVNFPALRHDGKDNLYVIWELFPAELRGRSRGLAMTVSGDGGETFAIPSMIPGTGNPQHGVNGSRQGLLMNKLAVNEAGRIAVVNSTFLANEASHIWLIRGRRANRHTE